MDTPKSKPVNDPGLDYIEWCFFGYCSKCGEERFLPDAMHGKKYKVCAICDQGTWVRILERTVEGYKNNYKVTRK